MLCGVLNFVMHRHVKDFNYELDLRLETNAEPWYLEDIKSENSWYKSDKPDNKD